MKSTWPSGWVCQCVRAPGSKRTRFTATSGGSPTGAPSLHTVPVNQSSGPRAVCMSLGVMTFMGGLPSVGSYQPSAIGFQLSAYLLMADSFLCQSVFEDREQVRLVVVIGGGFLHLQRGCAAPDLEARDVIVEPGLSVHEVPAQTRVFDAGQAGENLADTLSWTGPAKAHDETFGEAQRISQGGAGRLIDGGLCAVAKVHSGQVAVVHVAGENRHGGGRVALRALARGDGA